MENRFRVRVSLIYLDLDELDQAFAGRWFWSTSRPAPARFRRSDYLGDPQQPLRKSVADLIRKQGGSFSGGPIRLLTHFRYWGLSFNPVSFYYCYSKSKPQELEYIVAEVTNTPWKQKHAYVLQPVQFQTVQPQPVPKSFHVSPFMTCDMHYLFRINTPEKSALVQMENVQSGKRIFDATMKLTRRPINAWNLARVLIRYPAMTAQVVGHIYFQALKLWWKGVKFVPHPEPGKAHGNLNLKKLTVNFTPSSRYTVDGSDLSSDPISNPAETITSI